MTPQQALASHLAKRPEMPHPYVPDSPAAKAPQKALQAWVNERERLESALTPSIEANVRQTSGYTPAYGNAS